MLLVVVAVAVAVVGGWAVINLVKWRLGK